MFLVRFITGAQEYSSNHFNKRDLVIKNIGKTPEFHLTDFFNVAFQSFMMLTNNLMLYFHIYNMFAYIFLASVISSFIHRRTDL